MKKNYLFFSLIGILFLILETSYINFSSFYKITDDKITSIFLKSQKEVNASKHITIIDVDAYSIQMLGQWPFSRDIVAQALINLTNAGAGIIGFDIVFSNPDKLSPHLMAKRLGISGDFTNNDELMANILSQAPVILGYYFTPLDKYSSLSSPKHLAQFNIEGSQDLDYFNSAQSVVDNIDILKNAAYSSGYFNLTNIENNIVNRLPILLNYNNMLYPSLIMEMLRITSQTQTLKVINSNLGVVGIQMGDINIPTSKNAEINLNFRGKGFSYKYISFYDIVINNFQMEDINTKFILIGSSDIGLNDLVATIYDPVMPGVEVHATAIDNILNSDFFYTPVDSYLYGVFLIFLTTIILSLLLYYLSASYSFLIFLSSLFLLIYSNYYLIFTKHIIIGFSAPFIALFFTTGVFALISYYFENLQRKKIFNLLSTKVSKNVADEILKHDANILNVKKREISVLFSDIRGFTRLSEEIQDPQILIKILNKYMSPMADAVTEFDGTVDKFIGDALMAYWNAPLYVENHADMAVQSALKQLDELNKLNIGLKKEFNIELHIGIGINSGEAILGEMGSRGRSDYTIIGDTVNVASRVENLTKKYGYPLLITQQTKDLLQDNYQIDKIDSVQIRGKQEKTILYSVSKY